MIKQKKLLVTIKERNLILWSYFDRYKIRATPVKYIVKYRWQDIRTHCYGVREDSFIAHLQKSFS